LKPFNKINNQIATHRNHVMPPNSSGNLGRTAGKEIIIYAFSFIFPHAFDQNSVFHLFWAPLVNYRQLAYSEGWGLYFWGRAKNKNHFLKCCPEKASSTPRTPKTTIVSCIIYAAVSDNDQLPADASDAAFFLYIYFPLFRVFSPFLLPFN